jgi:hypothetical protein
MSNMIKQTVRDTLTNHYPPTGAQCPECDGGGRVWKKNWQDDRELGSVIVQCNHCVGTGLSPIPSAEVIWGIRRGTLVTAKANIWNGRMPEP